MLYYVFVFKIDEESFILFSEMLQNIDKKTFLLFKRRKLFEKKERKYIDVQNILLEFHLMFNGYRVRYKSYEVFVVQKNLNGYNNLIKGKLYYQREFTCFHDNCVTNVDYNFSFKLVIIR